MNRETKQIAKLVIKENPNGTLAQLARELYNSTPIEGGPNKTECYKIVKQLRPNKRAKAGWSGKVNVRFEVEIHSAGNGRVTYNLDTDAIDKAIKAAIFRKRSW